MLEKFIKFSNYFLIACIWLSIYTIIERALLLFNWGFDLLSYRHWRILNAHWQAGWKIDTFYEWAFILLLFTFVPLYFATTAYILHPETLPKIKEKLSIIWNNKITGFIYNLLFVKKVEEKKEEIIEVKEESSNIIAEEVVKEDVQESYAPVEITNMRKNEGEKYFNQEKTEIAKEEAIPVIEKVEKEKIKKEENINDILNRIQGFIEEDVSKSEDEELKVIVPKNTYTYESVIMRFEEKGYYVIKDEEMLHGLDMIALSSQKMFFMNFLTYDTSWVADEEFLGDSEPVWISSVDSITSPVYETKILADDIISKIQKVDSGKRSFITSVCLLSGSVQNEDSMQEVWKEKRVYVLNENQNSKLKKIDDFLNQEVVPLKREELDKIKKALK